MNFSGEANFHIYENVIGHNANYWIKENPDYTIQTILYSPKDIVSAAISLRKYMIYSFLMKMLIQIIIWICL